ncbi:putative acetyl-CoA C-acyltransferase [Helianthus anomalus]
MTKARCVATLLHEMKRHGRDCRFGVVSMCIGMSLFNPSYLCCVCTYRVLG